MNVLLINKFFWIKGGSEAVFFGDKSLLESAGHHVIPFSMQDERNLESEYSKYFVSNIDYANGSYIGNAINASRIIFSMEARRNIRKLVSDITPDIAHFHIFQHQITPSVFAPLRKRGIPIVLTLHDLKPLCPNYMMYTEKQICERCKGRKFYNCVIHKCTKDSRSKSFINMVEMYLHYFAGYYQDVDQYIAVSQFHRSKMIEYGFPESQISYVPNCIDTSQFSPSGKDDGYALFFGRLSEEKGLRVLLDAASLCPDIPIVITGTGPEEQNLKQAASRSGLTNIKFVGFKSGDALKDVLDRASFTIISSKLYENCPMTILESMAMRKPVIGSRIGGIPELINEGENGFLFDVGDHEGLAEKMKLLWESPSQRAEIGSRGREMVSQHFSPEKHLQQLLSVYRNVGLDV
ncbi:MAG TPA: glycosyltransferase family 1 protein [Chromatiaceae bacterium]|nr:glycosyltransferase family 1 protein [Chromatiaceae bacterium]